MEMKPKCILEESTWKSICQPHVLFPTTTPCTHTTFLSQTYPSAAPSAVSPFSAGVSAGASGSGSGGGGLIPSASSTSQMGLVMLRADSEKRTNSDGDSGKKPSPLRAKTHDTMPLEVKGEKI